MRPRRVIHSHLSHTHRRRRVSKQACFTNEILYVYEDLDTTDFARSFVPCSIRAAREEGSLPWACMHEHCMQARRNGRSSMRMSSVFFFLFSSWCIFKTNQNFLGNCFCTKELCGKQSFSIYKFRVFTPPVLFFFSLPSLSKQAFFSKLTCPVLWSRRKAGRQNRRFSSPHMKNEAQFLCLAKFAFDTKTNDIVSHRQWQKEGRRDREKKAGKGKPCFNFFALPAKLYVRSTAQILWGFFSE